MMKLACCVWTLTIDESDIFAQMNQLGFEWVDIQPHMLRSDALRAQVASLGLQVSCVGVSFGLPDGTSLDSTDAQNRQHAIDHVMQAIDHAHTVGASCVYVVPGMDTDALNSFADSLRPIADHAEQYGIKVGIEHFPGRALPTAQGTLDFIHDVNHDNLYLLLDSGHLQMSNEDAPTIIQSAGDKLAYVHLDDNDGVGDLHWSLLTGVMTEASLQALFDALQQISYDGMVSLELSPRLEKPLEALRDNHAIVAKYL